MMKMFICLLLCLVVLVPIARAEESLSAEDVRFFYQSKDGLLAFTAKEVYCLYMDSDRDEKWQKVEIEVKKGVK